MANENFGYAIIFFTVVDEIFAMGCAMLNAAGRLDDGVYLFVDSTLNIPQAIPGLLSVAVIIEISTFFLGFIFCL